MRKAGTAPWREENGADSHFSQPFKENQSRPRNNSVACWNQNQNFYSIKKIDSYVVVFFNVSVYCLCLCPKKTGIFLGIAWKLAKTFWQGLSPSKPIEYLFSRKVVSMTWLIESIWVSWCCCYCWWGRAAASCLCAKLEYASHQYSKQTQSYNLALLLFYSLPFVLIIPLSEMNYWSISVYCMWGRGFVYWLHGVRLNLTKYLFVVFVSISLSARPELWAALIL